MDPFAAIGLVSNIISFLDCGVKIIHGARDIYQSSSGMTEQNNNIESIATQMERFASELVDLSPAGSPKTQNQQALCDLASECSLISTKIIKLLGKLKPKDPNSKAQSLWAGVKSKYRGSEIKELETRLSNCRSQLGLQLQNFTSLETKTQMSNLVKSSQEDGGRLEQLQKHIEKLQKGTTVKSFSIEAQNQLQSLLTLSEKACETILQQRILNSLAFEGMSRRFDSVTEAHKETLKWIFDKSDGKDFDYSGSESFRKWLSSDEGIFHISGKIGSGKSTLMKYLCEHADTRAGLERWAVDRKMVFANFFFWKSESQFQRSLEGLYRSLLHDTLKECPEIIPDILPARWNEVKVTPWQVQTQLCINSRESREAFDRLISHPTLYEKRCFCYFIDGLDEYEETPQEDYKSLVEFLKEWIVLSQGGVKLCVSSREYNVFLNAFPGDRRIRLQDLTKRDMQKYVREKLHSPEDSNSEKLVNEIVQKGNGIFLWVALVVKNFRACLEDSYELSELRKFLDTPPDELKSLFHYLLRSLQPPYRRKAGQLFAMTSITQQHKAGLSPIACSFLEDFDADPLFATRADFPYTNNEVVSREAQAIQRINGCCKGLLEFKDDGPLNGRPFLSFAHSSVPEFLESGDFENDDYFNSEGFAATEAITQLWLAEIRTTTPHSIPRKEMSCYVYSIVSLRHLYDLDKTPFFFLEVLTSAVALHEIAEDPKDVLELGSVFKRISARSSTSMDIGGIHISHNRRVVTRPVYIAAIVGELQYIKWKLANDTTILTSEYQTGILILCSKSFNWTNKQIFHQEMLKHGVSPQAAIHKNPATNIFVDEMTYWVHLVSYIVVCFPPHSKDRKPLGEIFEEFLRFGADPRLSVLISTKPEEAKLLREYEGCLRVKYANKLLRLYEENDVYFLEMKATEYLRALGGKASALEEVEIHFKELIRLFKFENEPILLELIDTNLEVFEEEYRGTPETEGTEETRTSHENNDIDILSDQDSKSVLNTDSKTTNPAHTDLPMSPPTSETSANLLPWTFVTVLFLGITFAITVALIFSH